uniref:Uncharacterized protein n=1 Tax=Rhizophora mucronata TaxID=61149 RepID=A0A2P2ITQ8_RHIMU
MCTCEYIFMHSSLCMIDTKNFCEQNRLLPKKEKTKTTCCRKRRCSKLLREAES